MTARKLLDSLANLEKVVTKLEKALLVPRNSELVFEGTIHRFEMTIELTWKTLKRALKHEGFRPKTPRESVNEAFQLGWISDESVWLDMIDQRNTTSHEYLDEENLEENYDDVVRVTPILRKTLTFLQDRYKNLKP
ncbi:HI0074 family nucleotidyltransferase substrate-binding subunit [Agrobacterium rosae]|uniref:HI0074 family nucleotidyltransferase substrate-binding subunit n=1 Tax=Agrobacterium rosae TaxID=1972867 RepID=UPI000CD986FB|nr:HI0074 family nucleotidyltransferase substrate-binding subunit [Agrobacterium rosae]POO55024.1 nucleotidyltransferase [Agrobacterium rosae]